MLVKLDKYFATTRWRSEKEEWLEIKSAFKLSVLNCKGRYNSVSIYDYFSQWKLNIKVSKVKYNLFSNRQSFRTFDITDSAFAAQSIQEQHFLWKDYRSLSLLTILCILSQNTAQIVSLVNLRSYSLWVEYNPRGMQAGSRKKTFLYVKKWAIKGLIRPSKMTVQNSFELKEVNRVE